MEWFKHASPNAKIGSKDFAQLLGLNLSTFRLHLKQGKIPPPDTKHLVGASLGSSSTFVNKAFWNIATIKNYMRNRHHV